MLLQRILLCSSGVCRYALREYAGMLFGSMQACTSGGYYYALEEDAGMLFARTHRIFLKTLEQVERMCGMGCTAEPVTRSSLIFLFDHTGKCGNMRR